MNKTDLVKALSQETGFSQKDITTVVESMVSTITTTVANGEDVKISGLGTFAVTERAARAGRNPSTGETIQIAASKSPKFKAGKGFKDAVNSEN